MNTVAGKERVRRELERGAPFSAAEADAFERDFETAAELAAIGIARMPGIGFCSVRKRLNAFLAVCAQIDLHRTDVDSNAAMLALMIMRLANRPFTKAMTMFEIRAARFTMYDMIEMGQTAREFLSTLRR